MPRHMLPTALSSTLLMTAVQSAHAQQPPDIVNSDGNQNTAAGTSALGSLTSTTGCSPIPCNSSNTAVGWSALLGNTSGSGNTAIGENALGGNVTGNENTAIGGRALALNTSGSTNTASGVRALGKNTTGTDNTASGAYSLINNISGNQNTASGVGSMFSNTTGSSNAVLGYQVLAGNTTGSTNSAVGDNALYSNATGSNNTAFGYLALYSNVSGKGNAAQGVNALYSNTTGIRNLGIGSNALYANTTGSYNIALGFDAGYNPTTGSNNIEIGTQGAASDNNTIQIGVQGTQTSTTIAGIFGTTLTGSAVYVTASGQLGVLASSEVYKTNIAAIGSNSEKLQLLRPVSFNLKSDPQGAIQYGLIAEEVAKVYPELVIRDTQGTIKGVRYEELAPMLLNEMQHERKEMAARFDAQAAEIQSLKEIVLKMQPGSAKLDAEGDLAVPASSHGN